MSTRRQDAAPFHRPAAKVGLVAGPALCALFIVSFAEAIVLADFAALVFLWIFRAETPLGAVTIPGWSSIFSHPRYIIHPLLILIPVTLSCSCAFMMPVATPPNAIVFGAGRLRVADMVRSGLALNLIGVLVVVLAIGVLGPLIWHIDLHQVPDWAR